VYCDILDRIAFLYVENIISRKYLDYYSDYFNYAATMMWYYFSVYEDITNHPIEESWPSLISWFENNEINPYGAVHLPDKLQEILKGKNINSEITVIKKSLEGKIPNFRFKNATKITV
jgi:hypothetical protein